MVDNYSHHSDIRNTLS